ncbi:MAG: hypothetical protein JST73_04220, partial [Actinobacteria bacterium]|nr:hypothetical protein [Actinomycetota bacterium]
MELADLAGAEVVLLGVGIETLSVLAPLRAAPVGRIRVVEAGPIADERRATLESHGIDTDAITGEMPTGPVDVVLRSPGFPRHRVDVEALCADARIATTPTGLWLAIRGPARTIVVTGTKGKSSTVTLIAQGLDRVGLTHEVVGNIGTPPWRIDPHTEAVVVAELSSYHGADLISTGEIAVLTLLAEDHLDWHGGIAAYRRDKLRILGIGLGDPNTPSHRFALADTALPDPHGPIVERVEVAAGADLRGHNVALAVAAVRAEAALRDVPVPDAGEFAATLAADYPELPGRFRVVSTRRGVTWIDDALGSNPSATAAALGHVAPGPAVLICGGHDRSTSLDPVLTVLDAWPEASLTVLWLGDGSDHRATELGAHRAVAHVDAVGSMEDAVRRADAVT